MHVFFKPSHQAVAPTYATTAVQEFTYFVTLFGTPRSQKLNVVELPGDTVPYAWAPEIAAIAGPSITEKVNYRLLGNAIAHQWWGVSVSPETKDDWWLVDGFSRYAEAMYVKRRGRRRPGGSGEKTCQWGRWPMTRCHFRAPGNSTCSPPSSSHWRPTKAR